MPTLINGAAPQSAGTFIDGWKIAANKPKKIPNGTTLTFGQLLQKYVVECEPAGKYEHERGSSHCCMCTTR